MSTDRDNAGELAGLIGEVRGLIADVRQLLDQLAGTVAQATAKPTTLDRVREALERMTISGRRSAVLGIDRAAIESVCIELVTPGVIRSKVYAGLAAKVAGVSRSGFYRFVDAFREAYGGRAVAAREREDAGGMTGRKRRELAEPFTDEESLAIIAAAQKRHPKNAILAASLGAGLVDRVRRNVDSVTCRRWIESEAGRTFNVNVVHWAITGIQRAIADKLSE